MSHTTSDSRTGSQPSTDAESNLLPMVPVDGMPVESTPAVPADSEAVERINDTLDLASEGLEELTQAGRALAATPTESRQRRPAHVALSLSIVMPVYNEIATIEAALERLISLNMADEIIVVDDGSTDGTSEKLLELATRMPLRVERHEQNMGKGAAIRTAIELAGSELVAIQDADMEYDAEEINVLRRPIEAGCCDVIYGSRYLAPVDSDPSRLYAMGNRMLTRLSNFFTGQNLTDMETCHKVFRRELLADVELRESGFGIEPELTAKLARQGGRIYELPIAYRRRSREEGKKIRLRDALRAVWCILRYAKRD